MNMIVGPLIVVIHRPEIKRKRNKNKIESKVKLKSNGIDINKDKTIPWQ